MGFIRAIWELILPLPITWRFGLFTAGSVIVAYQITHYILPLALWPEFLITDRLRHFGLRPLPGTYILGDMIVWLLHNLQRLTKLALWVIFLLFCLWYVRPYVADTTLAQYIDKSIEWWILFELRVLTNKTIFHTLMNNLTL